MALTQLAPAQVEAARPPKGRPIALLFHGGAYAFGSPSMMDEAAALFRAQGFEAVSVEYPLGDIRAARRAAKNAAKSYPRRRQVYAYGESAGGGIAAMLAATPKIEAAAGAYPAVDLTTGVGAQWGSLFACERMHCWARFSPALHPTRRPYLALVPLQDQALNSADTLAWAARTPLVTAITYPGDHVEPSPAGYGADIGTVAEFFRTHP